MLYYFTSRLDIIELFKDDTTIHVHISGYDFHENYIKLFSKLTIYVNMIKVQFFCQRNTMFTFTVRDITVGINNVGMFDKYISEMNKLSFTQHFRQKIILCQGLVEINNFSFRQQFTSRCNCSWAIHIDS